MDGVLIIDKPEGITSHDVVARVRRILDQRRVGHTGTLDPFATGVLVVLVGRATRLAQFLSNVDKAYEAVIRLGFATDTGDRTGKPLTPAEAGSHTWSETELEAALSRLRGEIEQIPPMYSAKKQGGRKLYEMARRGEAVQRQPVPVKVHSFNIIGSSKPCEGTTDFEVSVVCSAGTYIRTLAEDLGKQLGVGAHLVELRRTRVADFTIAEAMSLPQLEDRVQSGTLAEVMLTPDEALQNLPFVSLDAGAVKRTQQGLAMKLESDFAQVWGAAENIRMRDEDGNLIAIGTFDGEAQLLRPRVVLSLE